MNDAFRLFESSSGDNVKPPIADSPPAGDPRAPAVVNLRAILAVAIQVSIFYFLILVS